VNPLHLKALINRFASKQAESIRLLADVGCDGVMFYDDWGLQDRLMVSPELIEEFFMPYYRANWGLAQELGLDTWMHSCGYIIDILPVFAQAGLNVIQMDQQENIGLENLARKAGGQIAFWCPVDIQKTMTEGSTEDIENYVARMLNTIGNFNGGLISMAYTTPEDIGHSPEKVAAMCRAFREKGVYKKLLENN
jgi:uroporphyrinogen decarboxylase